VGERSARDEYRDAIRRQIDRMNALGRQSNPWSTDEAPWPFQRSSELISAAFDRMRREEKLSEAAERSTPRTPDQLPVDKVTDLKEELVKRREASYPKRGPLTQTAIAARVRLNADRVKQGQKLMEAGWDLLTPHPLFAPDPGFVRWPQPKEVPELLPLI